MNQFAPILPEMILTAGGILLMMVAAFAGRRSAGVTSWSAVALLVAASLALIGPASSAGPLFGGLIAADAFGAFGKVSVFIASAIAIIWQGRSAKAGALSKASVDAAPPARARKPVRRQAS